MTNNTLCPICNVYPVGAFLSSESFCSRSCSLAAELPWNRNPKPVAQGSLIQRNTSLYGGLYHGPSDRVGPTDREYQQLLAEEYDQRQWDRDQA
jgi:hypothetical protein